MKLTNLLKTWVLEELNNATNFEADYFTLNEISINPNQSYEYEEITIPLITKAYQFNDRCGNTIVAALLGNEFKTGYKVEGIQPLIFQPERWPDLVDKIRPCPDDRKISTIYNILVTEIIPNYLLNKLPNKIIFNPTSISKGRILNIMLNKVLQEYPQLQVRNGILIYI